MNWEDAMRTRWGRFQPVKIAGEYLCRELKRVGPK